MTQSKSNHVADRVKGVFTTRVIEHVPICQDHWRFTVEVDDFPPAVPGQFVQIQCSDPDDIGRAGGVMIRRPFSIAGVRRRGNQCELDVILARVGAGTRWLSLLRPGDRVSLLGPLGNGFQISDDKPKAWLVGGGVGLPPLIWLAQALREKGKEVLAFCGARTEALMPLTRCTDIEVIAGTPAAAFVEFAASSTPTLIATDDGSLGLKGLVTDQLVNALADTDKPHSEIVVYTCGPDRMMRAVAELCQDHDISCQVCLERTMACGMGTCQSCVVPVRNEAADDGWQYRLCCTDGPVFSAESVIWKV